MRIDISLDNRPVPSTCNDHVNESVSQSEVAAPTVAKKSSIVNRVSKGLHARVARFETISNSNPYMGSVNLRSSTKSPWTNMTARLTVDSRHINPDSQAPSLSTKQNKQPATFKK